MSWPELEFGESVSGLLIDGVEGTPYVGATCRMTDPHGVLIEVPYLSRHGAAQFENVDRWFSDQSPPENMILRTPDGAATLFDVEWSGHSENWGGWKASMGRLRPHEVVFAPREGSLSDPLKVQEVHSRVDGLSRWSGARAIETNPETDDQGRVQAVNIRMSGETVASWQQGDATMRLTSNWTHSPERDGVASVITLEDSVTLESEFADGPHSFWDHFVEQRKVATLLVFLFGKPISFRRHQIRDSRFPSRRGGGGDVYDVPLRELVSQNTIRERRRAALTVEELGLPLVHFDAIGAGGLTNWANSYDRWQRFIVPSAGALNRSAPFVEDVVLSTSLSLEAAGHLLGEKPNERQTWHRGRPTTATFVFRCLSELDLEWSERIESLEGLARAVASNYNDLKHADRGEFPDPTHTFLVSYICRFVVAALAVSLTSSAGDLRDAFQQSRGMSGVSELFHRNDVRITSRGTWIDGSDPAAGPEEVS